MASTYTEAQMDHYMSYISLPKEYHRGGSKHQLNLNFLTMLYTHQISTIPYENLSVHYPSTNSRVPSLNPQHLFAKFTKNGRGGYCMETAVFFKHVLLALGFNTYTTGARVRPRKDGVPAGPYLGWVHSVNIVTLPSGERYMVDVGFGGDGATHPLPLDPAAVTRNMGTQDVRLVRDFIQGQSYAADPAHKLWVYQYRNAADVPWNSFYAFSEVEFLESDFEVMNFFTSTSHDGSFQTWTVLVVKFLRRQDEVEVYGKVMLVDGQVKRNNGGKTNVVKTCTTEDERIEALNEYFGIELTEIEKRGIKGYTTELGS